MWRKIAHKTPKTMERKKNFKIDGGKPRRMKAAKKRKRKNAQKNKK